MRAAGILAVVGAVVGMWTCASFTTPTCDEIQITHTIRESEDAASSLPRGRVRALKERVGQMVESAAAATVAGDTGDLLRKALLNQFSHCGVDDVLLNVAGRGLDTLIVTVGFPSQCEGQPDETLYLLEKDRTRGWHLVLGYGYGLVDDVPHSLMAIRLTSDREQNYFALDGVKPGCMSEYRPWFVRLFGRNGQVLSTLASSSFEVHITEPYSVHLEHSVLKLEFENHGWLDQTDRRRRVHTYCINGTSVERCGTLGDTPASFLEEWITAPWDVARQWVSRGDPVFETVHSRLASESGIRIQMTRIREKKTRVDLVRYDMRDVLSSSQKGVAVACIDLFIVPPSRGFAVDAVIESSCTD